MSQKVKILDNDLDDKYYHTEIQNLIRMKHSSINLYLNIFVHDKKCYLINHFIPGQSLEDYIFKKPSFSEVDLKMIAIQLHSALSYIHKERNTSHLKLNPYNIIVQEDLIIKVFLHII